MLGWTEMWLLVGQIAGRLPLGRMHNFSGFKLDMHCNSVYDRRLLYSFHHASAVPKHLHSGLSLFLYGESYDPGRIGTDRIVF